MVTAVVPPGGLAEASAPSLVTDRDNSAHPPCPNSRWVWGRCEDHGKERRGKRPCERRDCEVCGPNGRYLIAKRIAHGVRTLGPCSFQVLTFETYEAEKPVWKPKAVRRLGAYVRWLRKQQPGLQYVATYELQKSGRLHINLIMGPWEKVPQEVLEERWGARVWVNWVRDSESVGREVAKSNSPEALGRYLAKVDQAVPEEWGRRVSYSKAWPELPSEPALQRRGRITWRLECELSEGELAAFQLERERGLWVEVEPGEWERGTYDRLTLDRCDCYDLVPVPT